VLTFLTFLVTVHHEMVKTQVANMKVGTVTAELQGLHFGS